MHIFRCSPLIAWIEKVIPTFHMNAKFGGKLFMFIVKYKPASKRRIKQKRNYTINPWLLSQQNLLCHWFLGWVMLPRRADLVSSQDRYLQFQSSITVLLFPFVFTNFQSHCFRAKMSDMYTVTLLDWFREIIHICRILKVLFCCWD